MNLVEFVRLDMDAMSGKKTIKQVSVVEQAGDLGDYKKAIEAGFRRLNKVQRKKNTAMQEKPKSNNESNKNKKN